MTKLKFRIQIVKSYLYFDNGRISQRIQNQWDIVCQLLNLKKKTTRQLDLCIGEHSYKYEKVHINETHKASKRNLANMTVDIKDAWQKKASKCRDAWQKKLHSEVTCLKHLHSIKPSVKQDKSLPPRIMNQEDSENTKIYLWKPNKTT